MGFFDDVQSITINDKEVSKIEATIDGDVATIWEKETLELITLTVIKVWDDSNDRQRKRPAQLICTCTDGTNRYDVVLSSSNDWTASLTLPKYVNNVEANYTWREQEVLGYKQSGMTTVDNTTTFTNKLGSTPTPPPSTPTEPIEL